MFLTRSGQRKARGNSRYRVASVERIFYEVFRLRNYGSLLSGPICIEVLLQGFDVAGIRFVLERMHVIRVVIRYSGIPTPFAFSFALVAG